MLKKMIFKMRPLAIILMIWLFFLNIAYATDDNKGVIKVGYDPSFDYLINDLENLGQEGYGYEIFEKISEISDLEFEYVEFSGDAGDAIEAGTIDMAGFYIRTDEREKELIYSETQFGKAYAVLLSNNPEQPYDDPKELDGKTVASYKGNFVENKLNEYCENNNISVNYVYGDISSYMGLEADYYLAYSVTKASKNMYNALNLGVYNLYLVTSKDKSKLMDEINKEFLDLVNEEGNFFLELEEKYLADNVNLNHRSLRPEELAKIQERTLRVGYLANREPIVFQNDEGKPDGAMVGILDYIADKYGITLEYHPYTLVEDETLHNDYDILLTMYGDLDYEERYYDITEPFYSMSMYAQIRESVYYDPTGTNSNNNNILNIGMLEYLLVDYEAFSESFNNAEITFYDDLGYTLDDFLVGGNDVVISTESATAYVESFLRDEKTISVSTDLEVQMALLVSKNISNEYLPIFNVMLDTIPESTYESIIEKHSGGFLPETTFVDIFEEYWYIFLIVAIFIALILLLNAYFAKLKEKEEVTKAFNTDRLTGLISLEYFTSEIKEKIKNGSCCEFEIISFDIDLFKTINTHYSNERGTEVILEISKSLQEVFSDIDTLITRRTADEFLIFCKTQDAENIEEIFENSIRPNVTKILSSNYNVSFSFGIYIIENVEEDIDNIIGYADTARIQGKNTHKTTFYYFDEKMHEEFDSKLRCTFRMEQALIDHEFVVVYQPKVNFKTLKIAGAEALVRWKPQDGTVIYPDSFIPVFEANGFIKELDMYVLKEVCKFIENQKERVSVPIISVNLSTITIISTDICDIITGIVKEVGLLPSQIEFEITESAITNDETVFLENVKSLKELGFQIAIDDFGAGVSSLNRLSAINADTLKLDKAFFDLKEECERSTIVVEEAIHLAKRLDMKVVAEGVETYHQALWLRGCECDYAQGYYFERPVYLDRFVELLEEDLFYEIKL